MSEFAVYRTLANGRCLVLDGTRIAGGKPDYRGNNYITSWVTNKTYGPVDELKSENAKLRELVKEAHLCMVNEGCCEDCYATHGECPIEMDMRELGIEVPD